MAKLRNFIKLIRPYHWMKNVLIFVPLLCSGRLLHLDDFVGVTVGFVSFSLLASAIYIFNDYYDIEADKQHPVKKHRPLAGGTVSKVQAKVLFIVLVFISFGLSLWAARDQAATIVLASYLAINIVYSVGLKHVAIIDVAILSAGFILRVLYGGMMCSVDISSWLFLTIMSFSFYLALGKRRGELLNSGDKSRRVLRSYNVDFLTSAMNSFMTATFIFYALWANQQSHQAVLWSTLIVLLIFMKYSLIVSDKDSLADPADVLIGDKVLAALVLSYGLYMIGVLYV